MINTRTFDKTTEKREELYSVRDKNTYKGVMTGAGVTNFEFHNPAPEEGFCRIQMMELNEFRNSTGTFRFSGTLYFTHWLLSSTGPMDRYVPP
jgi:hypothetical protein